MLRHRHGTRGKQPRRKTIQSRRAQGGKRAIRASTLWSRLQDLVLHCILRVLRRFAFRDVRLNPTLGRPFRWQGRRFRALAVRGTHARAPRARLGLERGHRVRHGEACQDEGLWLRGRHAVKRCRSRILVVRQTRNAHRPRRISERRGYGR